MTHFEIIGGWLVCQLLHTARLCSGSR